MEKQIKDYLALYLGCEVIGTYNDNSGSKGILTGITNGGVDCEIQFFLEDGINVEEEPTFNDETEVKLILRTLSDMTEEEKKELALMVDPKLKKYEVNFLIMDALQIKTWGDGMSHVMYNYSPEMVVFLLSRSFDLFGLIDAGLALDKTKL